MASAGELPCWKIYLGGLWASYSHEDVRQWLWEATTVPPVSIKLWKRQADATKQSAFVGYATEEQARSVLRILQQRPVMWGERISPKSRDNPGAGTTPKAAPAVPASSSRPTTVDQGVQTDDVVKVDQEIASGQEQELGCKVNQAIDADQEEEMPIPHPPSSSPTHSPSTIRPADTEPANSPTQSPPTTEPSSPVGTAYGDVADEFLERIRVKRELEEAETECKKLKKEMKEERD